LARLYICPKAIYVLEPQDIFAWVRGEEERRHDGVDALTLGHDTFVRGFDGGRIATSMDSD
jgi:hypothetical protein